MFITIEEYQKMIGAIVSIVNLLAMPKAAAIKVDPPRVSGLSKPAEVS